MLHQNASDLQHKTTPFTMGLIELMLYRVSHTAPSASAAITFPSADSDLLIFFASSRTDPSAPVLLTWKMKKFMNLFMLNPEQIQIDYRYAIW